MLILLYAFNSFYHQINYLYKMESSNIQQSVMLLFLFGANERLNKCGTVLSDDNIFYHVQQLVSWDLGVIPMIELEGKNCCFVTKYKEIIDAAINWAETRSGGYG